MNKIIKNEEYYKQFNDLMEEDKAMAEFHLRMAETYMSLLSCLIDIDCPEADKLRNEIQDKINHHCSKGKELVSKNINWMASELMDLFNTNDSE